MGKGPRKITRRLAGSAIRSSYFSLSPRLILELRALLHKLQNVTITARVDSFATSFVGRGEELNALDALASGPHGVLVVGGPPGVGKSRLVARWARDRAADVSMARADLAAAHDLEDALRRIGRALELSFGPNDDPVERISHVLRSRGRALLWLDDADAVIDRLADPIARWRGERLLIVLTSRRAFFDPEHGALTLAPLPHEDAVRLLIERARAVRADFVVTPSQRASLEDLARRLDALPLAIELCAPRLRLLSPAQLAARFETVSGDALRVAIERSFELLQSWERDALAQCSVFRDGFYLEAAESVVDLSLHAGAPDVLTVLESLVAQSLLRTEAAPELPDEVRIRHLGAVRERAAAELAQRTEHAADVRRRHASYYVEAAERWDDGIESPEEAECTARLIVELPNLEAAFERAEDVRARLRLGLVLHLAYQRRGPFGRQAELVSTIRAIAVEMDDARWLARAELARARVHRWANELTHADAALARAMDAAMRAGDVAIEASCARNFAANCYSAGDLVGFEKHLSHALAAATRSGRASDEVNARNGLGYLHAQRGDIERAELELDRALRLAQETAIPGLVALVHASLSSLLLKVERLDEAERHSSAAIEAYASLGYLRQWAIEHLVRARARLLRGALDLARADAGAALDRARWLGLSSPEARALALLGQIAFFERDFALARELLEDALARGVGDESHRVAAYAGAARAMLGNKAGARELFEGALASDEVVRILASFLRIAMGEQPETLTVKGVEARRIAELIARSITIGSENGGPRLEVSDDVRFFRFDGGESVDLTRRRSLRGVLHALVEQHRHARGQPISLDAVLEAGWPGERMSPESGARRVYVTINRLRKLGLEELLVTTGDGYMLEPRVDLVWVRPS